VLVLDEPFSGLDPAAEGALAALVGQARAAGTAVLLSGHDPAVFPAADAVLGLARGRLGAPPPAAAVTGTRLLLRRRDDRAAPAAVTGLPGVGQPSWDPERGLLGLVTTDPDLVLHRALAGGWSFVLGAPVGPEAG
jgi:energy-coupling factor transporter ATP-binding protein EcfA2